MDIFSQALNNFSLVLKNLKLLNFEFKILYNKSFQIISIVSSLLFQWIEQVT